jgi:hypothetical protein
LNAGVWQRKSRRHDADDPERPAFDGDDLPDDVGIAAESPHPYSVESITTGSAPVGASAKLNSARRVSSAVNERPPPA